MSTQHVLLKPAFICSHRLVSYRNFRFLKAGRRVFFIRRLKTQQKFKRQFQSGFDILDKALKE